jgi:hypothetical protein
MGCADADMDDISLRMTNGRPEMGTLADPVRMLTQKG